MLTLGTPEFLLPGKPLKVNATPGARGSSNLEVGFMSKLYVQERTQDVENSRNV